MNQKVTSDYLHAEGKLVFVNPDADGVGNGETIN